MKIAPCKAGAGAGADRSAGVRDRAAPRPGQSRAGQGRGSARRARPSISARRRSGNSRRRWPRRRRRSPRERRKLDTANEDFSRNNRLYTSDQRAIAKSEVDTTKGSFDASAGGARRRQGERRRRPIATSTAAEAQVESRAAQLAAAQAKVTASDAAVHDAERELSYATITAPVDGRIGNKNVEVGNRVQVGQALFALVEPDLWIIANFKETQLARMRPGQAVEITVDAVAGPRVHGASVDSISPATGAQFALLPPDNATGNFTKVVQRVPVKIVFDPESVRGFEDRVAAGLSVVVNVRIR